MGVPPPPGTVPPFVIVHTFCASKDGGWCLKKREWCLLIQRYFARFVTVREKQILARVSGIQKENWGLNHAFCRDNWAQIWKVIAIHCMYFTAF